MKIPSVALMKILAQGSNVQTLRFLLSVTAKPIVHVVCTVLNSKSNCNNIYYFLNFHAFAPAHLALDQ